MRTLIWAIAAIVAVLVTLTVLVLASAIGWLVDLTPGALESVGRVAQWPVPAWLALWVDPAQVEQMLGMVSKWLQSLATYAPWLSSLLGWIVPVLWIFWALVMLCLLAVAGLVHALVGKSRASSAT
jgi:hypothetical protein